MLRRASFQQTPEDQVLGKSLFLTNSLLVNVLGDPGYDVACGALPGNGMTGVGHGFAPTTTLLISRNATRASSLYLTGPPVPDWI